MAAVTLGAAGSETSTACSPPRPLTMQTTPGNAPPVERGSGAITCVTGSRPSDRLPATAGAAGDDTSTSINPAG